MEAFLLPPLGLQGASSQASYEVPLQKNIDHHNWQNDDYGTREEHVIVSSKLIYKKRRQPGHRKQVRLP